MKRYRRKTEYVEAQQWHTGDPPFGAMKPMEGSDSDVYYVQTDSGVARVYDGDWHAKCKGSDHVLLRPTVFEALYEPVE